MTQFILEQSALGAGDDFDGTVGAGLFDFPMTALPKSEKVICRQLGIYSSTATAAYMMAYFEAPPGGAAGRILVGAASPTDLVALDGGLAVTFCPGEVPRESNGKFWQLKLYSSALSTSTIATLAYDTERCCK